MPETSAVDAQRRGSRRSRARLLVAGVASLFVAGLAIAYGAGHARASGVPSTAPGALSYTGSLLTFGQPDNSSHMISVALWQLGASSAACSTQPATVQLENGQFTIPLPPACVTVIHQDPNVQVQVTIDTTVMAMTSIAAVPYALEAASVPVTPLLSNLGLTAAVASSTLTVTLTQNDGVSTPTSTNPVIIGFRATSATSGASNIVQVGGTLAITAPQGATLGQVSGNAENTYVYAQDNAGTAQLCLSTSANYDEGVAQSSTAIGATSTARGGLYCVAAASGPVRLIGRVSATEATAGTWATAPTNLALPPFAHVPGLTSQVFTASGTFNVPPTVNTVELLVVAGGGGGGTSGGGGGAGGMIYMLSTPVTPGSSVTVTVGGGGGGGAANTANAGTSGSNSSFGGITAIGGGAGGGPNTGPQAIAGGSGGGGGQTSTVQTEPGGAGTNGQGNAGGTVNTNGAPYPAAGGGGAGGPGFPPNGSFSGGGGPGLACSITGASVTYAGGGGGALPNASTGAGIGGSGGGGAGGNPGNAGTPNTGGGGGGGNGAGGGAGGSGIVVVRYQI